MFPLANLHSDESLHFVPQFKLECLRILLWIRIGNHNDLKKKHGVKIQNIRPKSGITGSVKSLLSLHKSNLSDPDNTGGI